MEKDKKTLNKNLLLLLLGRFVSDTGNSLQMVIMPLYIIDVGGSAATVGLFAFLSLVPALIVYPIAGVLGDRLNRKIIMVATDLASAVVILGLALSAYSDRMSLPFLLSIQVIVSLLNGLFDPATKGMLPQLVNENELSRANSAVAGLRTLAGLLGPVIGTMLYASLGITVVFFINGISFLLSGCSEMLIKYKHVKRESITGKTGFISDLSEGASFIFDNKMIRRLCMFFLIIYALIQPIFTVVLPLFFKTRLEYSDTQYGYLQIFIILGALLGSILVGILFSKDKKVTKPLVMGLSLLMGMMLAFVTLLFPHSILLLGQGTFAYFISLAAVLCFLSIAIMFINVPVQTYIQRATPNEYMSRVFSIVGMITKGGMPFGALVYGMILNKVEVHWTMLAATLLISFISVVFLISLLNEQEL
ncbi:Na+/melibiose symporter [Natronincola peptidivorans]|uniref:Na+/melibiose symporter n=1 Tax=Natronincola peptidivorans TaxID=426128 RepID=A0A1I0DRW8_9FIRM|nr:MFS transporter [Natronincola peptidivorans]SET35024.1 Na+/melibiose symporter [Natronincola peptidivorans]